MPRLAGRWSTLMAAMMTVVACGRPDRNGVPSGAAACRSCHASIYASYVRTAHHHTSALSSAMTIGADFSAGRNTLRTGNPGVHFVMEQRADGYYQTGFDTPHRASRRERFDLTVGSGRVGQSYLYWKEGFLFQLPVSTLAGQRAWINSPGYPDGVMDFSRPIVPRCLECHATYFRLEMKGGHPQYAGDYELGIGCSKCHGEGGTHVAFHQKNPGDTTAHAILNPAHFARDRQMDVCALCHAGGRTATKPPFSFVPGQRLADYFDPAPPVDSQPPDVHGNQVGLLMESKCYLASAAMTCTTCHNVHVPQRDVAVLASKCLQCHQTASHPRAREIGAKMITQCVNCHMPTSPTSIVWFDKDGQRFAPVKRSHRIAIYRDVSAKILRVSGAGGAAP